jgi:hypothetical protein
MTCIRRVRASSSAIAPVPSGELSSTTSRWTLDAVLAAGVEERRRQFSQPIALVVGRHDHRQVGRLGRRHVSTIIQGIAAAAA